MNFRAAVLSFAVAAAGVATAQEAVPAVEGVPQISYLDWEPACEGSSIRVTRVDGHILSIDASTMHFHEAREWHCHFKRGKIVSAFYQHSTIKHKVDADGTSALITEMNEDEAFTFYFPDHKLTGVPASLLEDLRTVLSKSSR